MREAPGDIHPVQVQLLLRAGAVRGGQPALGVLRDRREEDDKRRGEGEQGRRHPGHEPEGESARHLVGLTTRISVGDHKRGGEEAERLDEGRRHQAFGTNQGVDQEDAERGLRGHVQQRRERLLGGEGHERDREPVLAGGQAAEGAGQDILHLQEQQVRLHSRRRPDHAGHN